MPIIRTNQRGYTLVELTLAMAIFSLALLILTYGVIRLYRIYQAGIEIRNTQQTSRFIMEQLSRDARAATTMVTDAQGNICLLRKANRAAAEGTAEAFAFEGFKYYRRDDSSAGNPQRHSLHRVKFAINTGTNPTSTDCGSAQDSPVARDEVLSSPESVSVVAFQGVVDQGRLLRVSMTAAAVSGIDRIDPATFATQPKCLPGPGSEYCSITAMNTSILTQIEGAR